MELTKEQLRALLKRWFALYGGSTSEDRFSQAEMTALDRDTDLALRGLGGTTQEPVASTQKLACYGIVNNAGEMFMDEMCVSSDRHSLEELVERMRSDDPDNDWRVAPMFFGAPAGTVAVPREPTEAMWDAAWKSIGLPYRAKLSMHEIRTLFEKFHAAMLSAAPAAPEAGSEQVAVTEELPTTYRACDQNGDWREFEEIRSIRPAANRVLEMLESEGYGSTEATDALRTALECLECPDADCSDCPRKPARWVPQS